MGAETSIEWTHPAGFKGKTWNPVAGCRRISPGCGGARGEGGCYAEKIAMRFSQALGKAGDRFRLVVRTDEHGKPRGWNGRFVEIPEKLAEPLKMRRPTCYFVNSMSDLFGEGVSDEYVAAVFGVMAACPQHTFQVLTKRAERMAAWFAWIADSERGARFRPDGAAEACFWEADERIPAPSGFAEDVHPKLTRAARWPLPNVWIGVSVESPDYLRRLDELRKVPAAVRFVSYEPALADLGRVNLDGIGWLIVGGESGPGARPFDLAWARNIADQCAAASVSYFFKQAGARPILHGMPVPLADRKGGDVVELARAMFDAATGFPPSVFRREWPRVADGETEKNHA